RPALLSRGATLTWAELDARVDRCAAGLRGLGLAEGDRVAVHLPNTLDFPVVYFGVLRAGLVAVPVNPGHPRPELAQVLGDSGARALVTTRAAGETAQALAGELPSLDRVVLAGADDAPAGASTLDALLRTEPGGPLSARGGEDLAVVLYTSGTSGRPRGAMLSHRALLANLDQVARIDPPLVTSDDVVLLVLPLSHVYGLNTALGMVVRQGATGLLVERFDPVETLEEVRRSDVTALIGAPPMYVAWSMLPDLGEALSGVRLALSGAAPLPAAVLHRIVDATGRPVFEGYGLTETAPVLTTTVASETTKADTIGQPVPGVELRLVDESGGPVEEGDPGEIVVRGPNLFSGYWPDGAGGPDADGWFATGDVAYLDDDGDLHLVDRRRELVLVSGFNVYPREVEQVLLAHPDIDDAAVLGVPHPYTGESVKAVVVLREGARLSAEDVVAHCARSLARFKCPTVVEFVPELPHSATGKVSKGQIREQQDRRAAEAAP
ncbi:MAG: AMP-binding protein, partial [Actinomycetota bacterium]|nr:AMP-binding protein [Actinomycetota bacterium]